MIDLNPRLIVAKMTSYGLDGGWAHRKAHDINFASLTGIIPTLYSESKNKQPVMPSVFIGDVSSAVVCCMSILLAVLNKSKGYESHQIIDLSYAEAALYLSAFPMHLYRIGALGDKDGPGILNGGFARYNYYKSFDGDWFALGALEQKYYEAFLKALKFKIPDVLKLEERDQIALIQTKFSQMSTSEVNKLVGLDLTRSISIAN